MINKSLHIGLNRVDQYSYGGWAGILHGCQADAAAMADIAVKNRSNAAILYDQNATIRTVADNISLLARTSLPGDTVMITYSGHGGQAPDHNLDEKDGLDETWCLYDGMLIDDDFNRLLAQFQRGVRVIVVSDSCHAGTMTKAAIMEDNLGLIGLKRTPKAAPDYACRVAPVSSAPLAHALSKSARQKATVVLLSACADNQFSYDGLKNGLFTEKLLEVYNKGNFKGTYREFRKHILRLMPPEQTPQISFTGHLDRKFEAGPSIFI